MKRYYLFVFCKIVRRDTEFISMIHFSPQPKIVGSSLLQKILYQIQFVHGVRSKTILNGAKAYLIQTFDAIFAAFQTIATAGAGPAQKQHIYGKLAPNV